jgi:hypothetical protein
MLPSPDEFLAEYPSAMRTLANYLRALVKRELPESSEQVKTGWKLIALYMPGKSKSVKFGFILPHADSVSFGFDWGVMLNDPDGVLLGADERLKQVRYLSYRSIRDVKTRTAKRFVKQAAELSSMPSSFRMMLPRFRR